MVTEHSLHSRHCLYIPGGLRAAACCLLPAACCLLPAACCLLPAACCLLLPVAGTACPRWPGPDSRCSTGYSSAAAAARAEPQLSPRSPRTTAPCIVLRHAAAPADSAPATPLPSAVHSREELEGQFICFERCPLASKDYAVVSSTPPAEEPLEQQDATKAVRGAGCCSCCSGCFGCFGCCGHPAQHHALQGACCCAPVLALASGDALPAACWLGWARNAQHPGSQLKPLTWCH
jgi:hypothetical protein